MKMIRHSRRGMTLIELLVVTIILGLLMSLGLSVGSKLLTGADRRKTIATMAIIMGAIDTYYEQCGAYPPQVNEVQWNSDGSLRLDNGNMVPVTNSPPAYSANQYDYSDFLLLVLKRCPASLKALSALGEYDINAGAYCDTAFTDGFGMGMPLLYNAAGGLGGTPTLLSAGSDGKYKRASIQNQSGGSAQTGGKEDDITPGSE